jgi:hypothetical protein
MGNGWSGGGGRQTSRQSTADILAQEYQQLRPYIADVFAQNLPGVGQQVTGGYQGPFTAQITPEEQALVNQLAGYTGAQITPGQRAAEESRLATIRGERLTPTEQFQPWARAINEAFQEGTLQNVGQFTAAGQRVQESSPFARAEAISDRARADALSRVASDIYQTERGYQEQAARAEEAVPGQRAAVNAQQIQSLVDRLSATALPRLIEEMGIERGMEEFQRQIEVMLSFLGLGVQVTQPATGAFGRSLGWNAYAGM